jgi:hypothetical protein
MMKVDVMRNIMDVRDATLRRGVYRDMDNWALRMKSNKADTVELQS